MKCEALKDDEYDLLDLFQIVAENIYLLIFFPLVISIFASVFAYMRPEIYISQTILRIPVQAQVQIASILVSPIVLDPLAQSIGIKEEFALQIARMDLASQIQIVIGKDDLLRVDVAGKTPEQARTLASALIEAWLRSTVPVNDDRQNLETRYSVAQNGLTNTNAVLNKLLLGNKFSDKFLTIGDAGLLAMGELQSRYLQDVLSISRALKGQSRDVIILAPTLPVAPVAKKMALTAILSAVGTCLILLIYIFLRRGWHNAANDPEFAKKKLKLKQTLSAKNIFNR